MKFWPRKQPVFTDLIRLEDWQRIQDLFSSVTSIGLYTLDPEGKQLTSLSGQSRLCKDFLKASVYGMEACGGHCLPTFLGGKAVVDRNYSFVCPPGFHNFFAPLRIDSKMAAYLVMGPVILVMRKPKDSYAHLADDLDVDLEEIWKAIMEIRVISFYRAQTLIDLIARVGEFVLGMAYENTKMGKKFLADFSGKFSELLSLLLDLALQISGADMGSIMLLNKTKTELTMRAAKGLPDAVIKNTRVKVGAGLSGRVVQENRPMLLDDAVKEPSVKQQMRRPYLRSSMILPIGVAEKVFGVMNLGALEVSSVRFNKENMESMHKVIDLTIDALYAPLKQQAGSKEEYLEQLL